MADPEPEAAHSGPAYVRKFDVGAKAEIYRSISQLAATGVSTILISDDAEELIGMADRIVVFRGGKVAALRDTRGLRPRQLLLAAAHAPAADLEMHAE